VTQVLSREPRGTAEPAPIRGLPPGPDFPMWVQTALWQQRFEQFATWCHRKFGDYFTLRLPISRTVVAVSDPDAIKAIFADRGERMNAGEGNVILEPILGSYSLLLLDGPEHTRQRRLVHPPFHGSRMQRYGDTIREVTNAEIDTWQAGRRFTLRQATQSITLKVILRAVFGLEEGESMDHVERLLRAVLAPGSNPMAALAVLRRDFGPFRLWSQFMAARAELDAALYAEIDARRGDPGLEQRDDILSVLLQARDEEGRPMSNEELRDELMTLLLAGHETTATALAWFFDQVLHQPDVLRRLRAEAAAGETAYLDACISEVMRLRPVVAMVARRLREDVDLGGWHIPAGAVLAPNIFLAHRRPDIYPEPFRFRPERFLDARPETYAWLPFGGGIRRCIGADFATFEMKAVIPEILRRADLEPVSRDPEPIKRRLITLVPAHGTRVVARELRL